VTLVRSYGQSRRDKKRNERIARIWAQQSADVDGARYWKQRESEIHGNRDGDGQPSVAKSKANGKLARCAS
jgi:hypothetical protein